MFLKSVARVYIFSFFVKINVELKFGKNLASENYIFLRVLQELFWQQKEIIERHLIL